MIKVIAADDEQYLRNALKKIVPWEALGCELIKIVKNGRELIEACEELNPDIVITDIRMPVMDGLEACQYLMDNKSKARIIVLSAYSDFSYARTAMKYGVKEYVLKADVTIELPLVVERLVKDIQQSAITIELEEDKDKDLYEKMSHYVALHYREEISLTEVAELLHSNASYLSRLYKKKAGVNLSDDVVLKRIEKAKECLLVTDMKINDISDYVGFNDPAYFARMFRKKTGLSPKEYKQSRSGK